MVSDLLEKRRILLNVIVKSITDTMMGFTQHSAPSGESRRENSAPATLPAGAATMRLESELFDLELVLCLGENATRSIYAHVFHESPKDVGADGALLAAEILNMAFGIIRDEFSKNGCEGNYSLPLTYSGAALHTLFAHASTDHLVIPYSWQGSTFELRIYSGAALQLPWQFAA